MNLPLSCLIHFRDDLIDTFSQFLILDLEV